MHTYFVGVCASTACTGVPSILFTVNYFVKRYSNMIYWYLSLFWIIYVTVHHVATLVECLSYSTGCNTVPRVTNLQSAQTSPASSPILNETLLLWNWMKYATITHSFKYRVLIRNLKITNYRCCIFIQSQQYRQAMVLRLSEYRLSLQSVRSWWVRVLF